MGFELNMWIGKKVYASGPATCPTEGILNSVDENGVIINHTFFPWHQIEEINLPFDDE
jgi:hypothetical protein